MAVIKKPEAVTHINIEDGGSNTNWFLEWALLQSEKA